jgi:hypothetical protein
VVDAGHGAVSPASTAVETTVCLEARHNCPEISPPNQPTSRANSESAIRTKYPVGRSTRGDVCLGWARASSCWSNARCHSTRAHPWPGPSAAGRPGRARSEARLAEYSHTLGTGLVRTWSIPRGTFDLPILGRRKTGRVLQELRRLLALIERQDVVVDCPAAHLSTSAASQSSQQLAGLLVVGFWVIGRPANLLAQQLTVA